MSFEELIKTVGAFLVGGAASKYVPGWIDKLIDWKRHATKDRAEAKKTEAETDEIDTKIALLVAKELREDLREMREENKRLRADQRTESERCKKEMDEMSEKIEKLTTALYERDKRNNELERKIQKMEHEMSKYKPDARAPGR